MPFFPLVDPHFYLVPFSFPAWRTSFNISHSAYLLVMNYFRFSNSKNVFSLLLFLKYILTGYRNLGTQLFFSFSALNILLHLFRLFVVVVVLVKSTKHKIDYFNNFKVYNAVAVNVKASPVSSFTTSL